MIISTRIGSKLIIKKIAKKEKEMDKYFKTKNMIMTKKIYYSMEKQIINCIYDNIYKAGENQILDYLQVFSFDFCKKTKILTVIHEQEETEFTKEFKMEYSIPNIKYKSIANFLNEKIFCIDSIQYQTLLFGDEY